MKQFPFSWPRCAAVLLLLSGSLLAEESPLDTSIQFTVGLAGGQTQLSWVAQPGARYRVFSSPTSPALAGMQARAVVEATGADASWIDPTANGQRGFYWIEPAEPEVFSVEPAALSSGGFLVILAQCLPAGSSIVFDLEGPGLPPLTISALLSGSGGRYTAVLPAFAAGYRTGKNPRIVNGAVTVCTIGQTFEVTSNGFARQAPPILPPAAPNGKVSMQDFHFTTAPKKGGGGGSGKASFSDLSFMSAGKATFKEFTVTKRVMGSGGGGKVSVSDLSIMMRTRGRATLSDFTFHRSLPGTVGLEECDLSLEVPAGPPLHVVRTFSSNLGQPGMPKGWTHCYEASVQLLGLGGDLLVHDGTGRRDLFQARPDGSYVCDGHFKTARQVAGAMVLTFADQGTWTFHILDGSPTSGKLRYVTDRNGEFLTCAYDASGQLSSVSNQFGQSLTLARNVAGQITTVTDHTGRFVTYAYYGPASADGPEGALASVSCPTIPLQAPVQGPTTYFYSTGFADARRNGNPLRCVDGAGRLVCAWTYSASADDQTADFNRVVSVDRNRLLPTDPAVHVSYEFLPLSASLPGGLRCTINDELGRVTEVDFDRQYRCVSTAEFTGFATPDVPVTSSSNRPTGQLRSSDPASYVTTCAWNPQHLCTRCTEPDGLQTRTTYACDLVSNCPVRERGNAMVITLRSPGGEERSVSCSYLAGYGTCEGGDITYIGPCDASNSLEATRIFGAKKGYDYFKHRGRKGWDGTIKGGFADGDDGASFSPGAPIVGLSIKGGRNPGGNLKGRAAGGGDDEDCDDGDDGASFSPGNPISGLSIKGGRNPGGNLLAQGRAAGGGYASMIRESPTKASWGYRESPTKHGLRESPTRRSHCTRMTTPYGQTFTWGYDLAGNCTSSTTPVAGAGMTCSYNGLGQCTSQTDLNGAGASFVTQFTYDPATRFCSSVVRDPSGLALTVSCDRNALGLVTRVVNERGFDSLCSYNPCDQIVSVSSPLVGAARITCTQVYDLGGLPIRCDLDHLDAAGAPDPINPTYTGFCSYDARGRFIAEFSEQKPLDVPPPATAPDPLDLASYDSVQVSLNHAGEPVHHCRSAASTGQVDIVRDYQFDERGLLYRRVAGTSNAVTTECDYNSAGDLSACRTLAPVGQESPTVSCAYDGFRRLSSSTDEMGNVTSYSYDNQGFTTVQVHGEQNDVPGGTDNVLLARVRMRSSAHNKTGHVTLMKREIAPGSGGPSSSKKEYVGHVTLMKREPAPGSGTFIPQTTLDLMSSKHAINSQGTGAVKGRMGAKQKAWLCSNFRSAFFDVFVADDTCIEERFTPGQAAPHALETTTVQHSPAGLPISVTDTGDIVCTFAHDTAGRQLSCSQPGAQSVTCTLDACGNPVTTVVSAQSTLAGVAAETFSSSATFDALNRCLSSSDSLGSTQSHAFDSLSRCVSETSPSGFTVSYLYDVNTPPPGGFASQVAMGDLDGDGTPETLASSVCLGGVCSSSTDALGYATTYTCDSQGRRTRCAFPDGTSEFRIFDALGRAVAQSRRNNAVVACDFDLRGRCTSSSFSVLLIGVVPVPPTVCAFDGLDRCVLVNEGASVVSCSFDSLGNPVSETQNGHPVSSSFTHRGRSSVTYPGGALYLEQRDAHGRMRTFSAVDGTGTPISPPVTTCDYSGFTCVQEVRANGVATACDVRSDGEPALVLTGGGEDFSFGEVVRCTITDGASLLLEDHVIRRNRAQCETVHHRAFGPGAGPRVRRMTFTLDVRNLVTGCVTQVREAIGGPGFVESDVSYVLDARGQRIEATGGSHPGLYTQSSLIPPGDVQVGQYSEWPGGALQWDDNGCLTLLGRTGGGISMIYDAWSRLAEVQDSLGASLATYAYDGLSRRVSSTLAASGGLPPVTTTFLYDGDECIQELGGDGLVDLAFAVSGGVKVCISTRNGTLYYPHGGGGSTEMGSNARWSRVKNNNSLEVRLAGSGAGSPSLLTSSTGLPVERLACDDACQPIFLTSDGLVRPGATAALTGYRWLQPGCAWCPESSLFQCDDGLYSPELGQPISAHKTKPKPKATSEIKASWNLKENVK